MSSDSGTMGNASIASAIPRERESIISWVNGKLSIIFPRLLHTYISAALDTTHQPHLDQHKLLESPESLVRSIIRYNKQTPVALQDIRCSAIEEYRTLKQKHLSSPTPEDPTLLMKFLDLFDKMFFFGSLTGLCYIEVVDDLPECLGDCTLANSTEAFLHPYEVRIRITNRRVELDDFDPDARLQQYLGVLLHEALHAIFALYVYVSHPECKARYLEMIGPHGHLVAWQAAADCVEQAAKELLLEMSFTVPPLDMHRCSSLGRDMYIQGTTNPREELASWGLSWPDIDTVIAHYESFKASKPRLDNISSSQIGDCSSSPQSL